MSDHLRDRSDHGLGAALAELASAIEWPPTPDLAPAVADAILERERRPALGRPRLSLPSRRRTLVIVVASLLLIAAAAVAAKLVIDIGAVTVNVLPGRPTALPSAVASGPALGHPSTLEEATTEAGFAPFVPSALGPPDRVWVENVQGGARITLAWRAGDELPAIDDLPWGAILYEFRGDVTAAAKNLFAEGGTFREVRVDGRRGFWIEGEHELDLLTGTGTFERFRVSGHILLWRSRGLTLRLETEASEAAAIRIAQSRAG